MEEQRNTNPNGQPQGQPLNRQQGQPTNPGRPTRPRAQTPGQASGDTRRTNQKPQDGRPQGGQANPNNAKNAAGGKPGGGRGNGGGRSGGGGRGKRPRNNVPQLADPNAIPINRSIFNGKPVNEPGRSKGDAAAVATSSPDERLANRATKENKLKVMPLGGLGEVGKNMMAIEYENDIIVIDMGFGFPDELQPGIDYIIPDITYLEKNKHKVRGIIITHGHMDHIGASGYVLPKLAVPVYGTRLSLGMVEKQIEEFRLQTQPQFRVLDPDKHEQVQLGVFNIELVRVTHSIPDATAVVVRTPVGTVINTGDWRRDLDPIDGRQMDMKRLEEIGAQGVLLLMSDSTGCESPGHTPVERQIGDTFVDLFNRSQGRVILSTFASSVNRVQLIIDATHKSGRKLSFVGRSMLSTVELAVKLGYLKVPPGLIIKVQDIVRRPDKEVVILCTGSQGEVNSALTRMSTGDHPHVKIKQGDAVILSSSVIPGNEKSVVTSVDALMREGAKVYQRSNAAIDNHGLLHVSGHASRDEIVELLNIVNPKYFMPIHGEFHHLVRHAELAVSNGLPRENAFVMDNGDCLELTETSARIGQRIPSGIVLIDGSGVGDVENVVLRDRLAMAGDGVFMIVATVDRKSGKLIGSPDIISRGFVYMKDNEELISRARAEVRKSFEKRRSNQPTDWSKFKLDLRDDVSQFLYAKTKRQPMVLPVINEV